MGRLGALLRPTWRSYAGPPQGHYNPCTYCRAIYEKIVSRCFILPPEQGEVRRSRIGEASAASQSAGWLFCHMMQAG